MLNLSTLMTPKTSVNKSKNTGVSLGQFVSPVNGELIELVALWKGNRKIGDFMQLSVLPVDGNIKDKSIGRRAICGDCPHAKLGSCYAYDQGLFSMMKSFRAGKYPTMELDDFLRIAQTRNIRFGRFGDLSLLPYELVKTIADSAMSFTGYTNQWRSKWYDARFNNLFMVSTLGSKDSAKAFKMFPDARQFKVISTKSDYINDADQNTITCPSINGYLCDECGLCDGQNAARGSVNIEVMAHGLDYKSVAINRLLKSDISIKMV
jgi:hypothetical protein